MKMQNTSPVYTTDWLTRKLDQWQKHLAHLRGTPALGVEVGSYEGRSACWLLDNIFTNPDSHLTCIDPWKDAAIEDRFNQNIGAYSNVRKWKTHSYKALRKLRMRHYDFVYVDGDHSTLGVIEDAVLSFRLLRVGGVMIFDDYRWQNPNGWNVRGFPKPAIDFFLQTYGHRLKVLHHGYQVIIRRES
jgi:predicted O-methyltransferase YrrM